MTLLRGDRRGENYVVEQVNSRYWSFCILIHQNGLKLFLDEVSFEDTAGGSFRSSQKRKEASQYLATSLYNSPHCFRTTISSDRQIKLPAHIRSRRQDAV